ncbi:MAG: hypothetical protein ACTSWP_12565 [Candidatus Freyarchaeota archaeon]
MLLHGRFLLWQGFPGWSAGLEAGCFKRPDGLIYVYVATLTFK